jgi:hypothetical protein
MMRPLKFCSSCGERVESKRASLLPFRSFCRRCLPRLARARLLFALALLSCAAGGFITGRLTASRRPFYFIGTTMDSGAVPHAPGDRAPQAAPAPTALAETVCGARTKSGRGCRRKVKGGGHCWQHRK